MVSLPAVRTTQAGSNFLTGRNLGQQQKYQELDRAQQQQDRQTMMNAGNLAAGGDLSGARNAFYKGGMFDKGLAIDKAIKSMSNDRLNRAFMVQDKLARLAGAIETPEEFESAKQRLRSMGLPIPQNLTFEQLPQIRAEALSVAEQMKFELDKQKLAQRAAGGGLPKPPSGYGYKRDPQGNIQIDQYGNPVQYPITGGPADPARKQSKKEFSEGATKAANFANMMDDATRTLNEIAGTDEQGNLKPMESPLDFWGAMRETLTPEEAANVARSPEYQRYLQASRQWIRGKLRKESGAAIGDAEMASEFRTYFPQYGDGPEVIEQKRKAREQAERGMIAESRGAYQEFFGQPQQPPSGQTTADPLEQARDAIARGAPREAVIQRLRENGIDPSGL